MKQGTPTEVALAERLMRQVSTCPLYPKSLNLVEMLKNQLKRQAFYFSVHIRIFILIYINHMHNAFGRENPDLEASFKFDKLTQNSMTCVFLVQVSYSFLINSGTFNHKLTMNWSPATSGRLMIPRSCMKNILKHGLFVVHCPFETMNELTHMKVAGNQIQSISFEICSQIICSDI